VDASEGRSAHDLEEPMRNRRESDEMSRSNTVCTELVRGILLQQGTAHYMLEVMQ